MSPQKLEELRVALVDDSPHMCKLIRLMLSAFDIRDVRTFTDGAEAIRVMQYDPPDLLLCDWEMEPIDGLTLTRKVRHFENSRLAGIPIIMITGNSGMERIRTARAAGVTHVLLKPITPKTLYDRLIWALANPMGGRLDRKPPVAADPIGAGRLQTPMP